MKTKHIHQFRLCERYEIPYNVSGTYPRDVALIMCPECGKLKEVSIQKYIESKIKGGKVD